MKELSRAQDIGAAQLGEGEPLPLPPPPPTDFDDDHDFDDGDEPSWWSTIRPLSAVRAADPRPREAEPPRPPAAPVDLPPLPPARRRARTADDEARATAHVLRVRARLLPHEQSAFDELMRGPAATDIITMLVNRGEDDAIEKLRRRLTDEPTAAEASRRSLARRIGATSALLSAGEQAKALAALSSLWPEELLALEARLAGLSPPEAAALIRTYLAPRR
jgi:hypothetical protein